MITKPLILTQAHYRMPTLWPKTQHMNHNYPLSFQITNCRCRATNMASPSQPALHLHQSCLHHHSFIVMHLHHCMYILMQHLDCRCSVSIIDTVFPSLHFHDWHDTLSSNLQHPQRYCISIVNTTPN